jgi:hypothetical protein
LPKLEHAIAELTRLTRFECLIEAPAHDSNSVDDRQFRWSGAGLQALPQALTHLCLGQLSAKGVKELTGALAHLPSLKVVDLWDTLFVDDSLCHSLGRLHALTHVCIRQMSGSKVTDDGMKSLLEAFSLEVFELIEFEGRLSKRCWSKIDPADVSPTLRVLRFVFNEAPMGQHSWATDHLFSVSALVQLPSLEVFSIRRIPHTQIYASPRQSHKTLGLSELMLPKQIPRDLALALIDPDCPRLFELGLDFYQISLEQLQVLADCFRSSLQRLHVYVNDTMARVVRRELHVRSNLTFFGSYLAPPTCLAW